MMIYLRRRIKKKTTDPLAQLIEHQTALREVAGSNRTNTQGP